MRMVCDSPEEYKSVFSAAFQHDPATGAKRIRFCTSDSSQSAICGSVDLARFDFQNFHHLCVTATTTLTQRTIQVFRDGTPHKQGTRIFPVSNSPTVSF